MAAPRETEAWLSESDVVAALLPEVSRFLAREVDGHAIDRQGEVPASVREGLAALGLFGMTVPERYGGAGLTLGATGRVVAEIARVDRSIAIMLGLHAGLGTRGLVERGSEALKERWLPRLASGRCIASFAATEAEAGSDLTAVRTTGRVVHGGLRIDGEKSYVTNGRVAGLFTVLLRTPGLGGDRAHSLVCVPASAPGIRIGKEEDKLGIRGSSTVTVAFDGVTVPLDHVLGEPGSGMDLAHGLLTWGRTLMSAGCVGTARGALDATLAHVSTRRQFGGPISRFGATHAHVAWMAARVCAMRALVSSVAAAQARGEGIDVDSAMAKVFCSEGAFEVCDRAVQLHGALGFLEPTGVARMLRDCRITRIFEGANDVLLVRVGAQLLAGSPGEPCDRPPLEVAFPDDRRAAERIRDAERTVGDEANSLRRRFGVGAVRRQLALQRLAKAAICVRAARAVMSDPAAEAPLLRVYTAETLIGEAAASLRRLEDADRDETAAKAVSDYILTDCVANAGVIQ